MLYIPVQDEGGQCLELGVQVSQVNCWRDTEVTDILEADLIRNAASDNFLSKQRKDTILCDYLESGVLSRDQRNAQKLVAQQCPLL